MFDPYNERVWLLSHMPPYATVIDAKEGTFEVKNIPPGRYRIAVVLAPVGGTDVFKGKYDRTNSKVERDVKGDEDLIIDVDRPQG